MKKHLKNIGRAHKKGTLAGLGAMPGNDPGMVPWGLGEAGGRYFGDDSIEGLGDILDTSATFLTADQIARAADTFDVQLNSWLLDYAKAAATLPASLVNEVDAYVARWRSIKDGFYIFETTRITDIQASMAEWNGLRDKVASYGVNSSVGPAVVSVNGQNVAADKVPYQPDFFAQLEKYGKYAAIGLGVALVYKITSDLGLLKKIGGAL